MMSESAEHNMDSAKQRLASEILELGEMLFDTMTEAAGQQSTEGKAVDAELIEEMQAAADEYFTALRLLFTLE
jgi:division protein CdvB (Snf7/Vps24/ESCRT-III family)